MEQNKNEITMDIEKDENGRVVSVKKFNESGQLIYLDYRDKSGRMIYLEKRDGLGLLHSEDGPALIADGTIHFYHHGRFHNENGPAIVWPCGSYAYYRHGSKHNANSPACYYNLRSVDRQHYYYYNGEIIAFFPKLSLFFKRLFARMSGHKQ